MDLKYLVDGYDEIHKFIARHDIDGLSREQLIRLIGIVKEECRNNFCEGLMNVEAEDRKLNQINTDLIEINNKLNSIKQSTTRVCVVPTPDGCNHYKDNCNSYCDGCPGNDKCTGCSGFQEAFNRKE